MTLTRTWSAQAVNQAPTDESTLALQCATLIYAFKRFVTGASPAVAAGAWTVAMSSDGAANAGAADYWDAASKVVWNSAGSNHSWIVLKSPSGFVSGGFVYMLIDCQGTSAQNLHISFASAAYSGGSLTACPTSSAEQLMSATTTFQWHRSTGFPFTAKWHGTRNSVGDWLWCVSRDSAGYAHAAWGALSTTGFESTPTVDAWPAVFVTSYLDSGVGALGRARMSAATSRLLTTFWKDGTVTDNQNQTLTIPARADMTGSPPLDLVDVNGSDINTGVFYMWPTEVFSYGSGKIARRGKLVDVFMAPAASDVPQTAASPSDATPEIQVVGNMALPFATKLLF